MIKSLSRIRQMLSLGTHAQHCGWAGRPHGDAASAAVALGMA